MPGKLTVEATVDVFTGLPLVILIIEGDSECFVGSEVNLFPDEADRLALQLIRYAEIARKRCEKT